MDWAEKIMREAIGNATGDADAVSRAAAALRDEREACKRLASSDHQFSDCEARGFMDQETGEVPCSMERRTGVCECAMKIEHGHDIATMIERRNA